MSSPFARKSFEATPFAPRKKETMNIREQFVAYLHERGWTLDPERTLNRGRYGNGEKYQNPFAFIRRTADGTGTWHLDLDYQVEGGYSVRYDNTLRGLELWKTRPTDVGTGRRVYRLANPARKTHIDQTLWNVAGVDLANDYGQALRKRAERIGSDPDLAAWLYEERRYLEGVENRKAALRREAQMKKRKERNPAVTVSHDEYRTLSRAVRDAASRLGYVDGTTEVHKHMSDLRKAMAALEAVTTPEEEK